MLVIDTNVMLRLLLKDDPKQSPAARDFFARAQEAGENIYVSQAVIQELFWVLEKVVKLPRSQALRLVDAMLMAPLWEVEQPARVAQAIRHYEAHGVDFTDALLAAMSREKGREGVLSFDADIGKMGVPWIHP